MIWVDSPFSLTRTWIYFIPHLPIKLEEEEEKKKKGHLVLLSEHAFLSLFFLSHHIISILFWTAIDDVKRSEASFPCCFQSRSTIQLATMNMTTLFTYEPWLLYNISLAASRDLNAGKTFPFTKNKIKLIYFIHSWWVECLEGS